MPWRGRVRSSEEPAAFRIDRHGEPDTFTTDWELQLGPPSTEVPSRSSRYSGRGSQNVPEMTGLDSLHFNAHTFVQRMLDERTDKPVRASHSAPNDDSFDADTALAALDSIEHALHRRRDVAVRDEENARDDLRQELHASLKKRDDILGVAQSVSSALEVTAEDGQKAAQALENSVRPLTNLVAQRRRLIEAKDLVKLLTASDNGLNVVRASEILCRFREEVNKGTIRGLLSETEFNRAKSELERCENELSERLSQTIREGFSSTDSSVLRECAVAAENLGREDKLLEDVMSQLTIFSKPLPKIPMSMLQRTDDADGSHLTEPLSLMRWESTNALRDFLPTALCSFPKPLKVLSRLVQNMFQHRLLKTAKRILDSLREYSDKWDKKSQSLRRLIRDSNEQDMGDKRNIKQDGTVENLREVADKCLDIRRRLLFAISGSFRILTVAVHELIEICLNSTERELNKGSPTDGPRGPSSQLQKDESRNASRAMFMGTLDSLAEFLLEQERHYVALERMWVDEQIGKAFSEISNLDARAPLLAPSDCSEPDAYHRYRSFYAPITAAHGKMTERATSCTLESLHRASAVLTASLQVEALSACESNKNVSGRPLQKKKKDAEDGYLSPVPGPNDKEDGHSDTYEERRKDRLRRLGFQSRMSDLRISGLDFNGADDDVSNLVNSISYSLVHGYLANAETLIQAASHLLPTPPSTASCQELWVSGASPLSSYVQAVGALTKSDKLLDDFLASLTLTNDTSEPLSLITVNDAFESKKFKAKVRNEIRRELINGLKDLAGDAKVGIDSAIDAVGTRLMAILSAPNSLDSYKRSDQISVARDSRTGRKTSDLGEEPTMPFVSASIFIEQQLAACAATLSGNNLQYVSVRIAEKVCDVVIEHWSNCNGPFSKVGAIQLMVDARAVVRAFGVGTPACDVISVLSVLAQLHFDSPDEIWGSLESQELSQVHPIALLRALEKRGDLSEAALQKIRQALHIVDVD